MPRGNGLSELPVIADTGARAKSSASSPRRTASTTTTTSSFSSSSMSEYVPPSRPRPVRLLCLHGRGQSAASFRALLAPLIPRLPKNYEFHFLDAPYVVHEARDGEEARLLEGIATCSRIDAAQGKERAQQSRAQMETPRGAKPAATQPSDLAALRSRIDAEVLEAYDRAGIDECEMLLARRGFVAPDRDWLLPGEDAGLDHSLGHLSDYLRMHGPFHGALTGGSGSSWLVANLLSSLLEPSRHPQSALAYPTMFPLLPLDAPAPRMGGWEVMPSVALPSGRRTATSQGPLSFLIAVGASGAGEDALAGEAKRWAPETSQELLAVLPAKASSPRVPLRCRRAIAATEQDSALLAPPVCEYLAAWIRAASIAAEEVAGLDPADVKERDAGRQERESWHSLYRRVEDVPLFQGVESVQLDRSRL